MVFCMCRGVEAPFVRNYTHTHTPHIPTLPPSPLLAWAAASIGDSFLTTQPIEKIFVATNVSFYDASKECSLDDFYSVLIRQCAAGFHSWLW